MDPAFPVPLIYVGKDGKIQRLTLQTITFLLKQAHMCWLQFLQADTGPIPTLGNLILIVVKYFKQQLACNIGHFRRPLTDST